MKDYKNFINISLMSNFKPYIKSAQYNSVYNSI